MFYYNKIVNYLLKTKLLVKTLLISVTIENHSSQPSLHFLICFIKISSLFHTQLRSGLLREFLLFVLQLRSRIANPTFATDYARCS